MSDLAELIERVARVISPYGWDDSYWQAPSRDGHYDRNQRHVKDSARRAATAVVHRVVAPIVAERDELKKRLQDNREPDRDEFRE